MTSFQMFGREEVNPSFSIIRAMEAVGNPREMCCKIAEMTEEFVNLIKTKLDDPQLASSILYHKVGIGIIHTQTHRARAHTYAHTHTDTHAHTNKLTVSHFPHFHRKA